MKRERSQEPPESKVLHFIRERELLSRETPLLVAVSGGPDSVCLLHILVRLQDELGIKLHVAHLNHQLQGDEAEADARYVFDIAHRLGIPATVEARDVRGYQAQRHISLEEAAREVRYAFLAEVAGSIGAGRVAVGHTVDDHAETILMHLIRGAGIRGLRGLQPVVACQFAGNRLTVIRPLLPLSREETVSYCACHQLVPCIDASNLSLSPLRNKIRHQLLPLLRSYNPQISGALLRTASIAGDNLDFLDEEVSRIWDSLALRRGNTIVLDRERLLKLSPALQRHLLRASIEELAGNLKDIEAVHIEDMITALSKPAGKMLNLPGGLVFSIDYDKYLIGSEPVALCPFPHLEGAFPLKVPGETKLPGWRVTATTISREQMAENGKSEEASAPSEAEEWFIEGRVKGQSPFTKYSSPSPLKESCLKCHSEERSDEESVGEAGSAQIVPTTPRPFATLRATWIQYFWGKAPLKERRTEGVRLTENSFTAFFDLDKAGDKLTVRTRQPGDRFQPLGMSQSKKLGEFMIDARIPRAWRERVPLVCSPDQILWVVGWRIDERVKVTEATRKVLFLEFKRDSSRDG